MDHWKEILFHLCKRVWPNANKLTANMDRTDSPDSDSPSISCQFCKTATLFKDLYAGSNHCLGVSVFLEEMLEIMSGEARGDGTR